MLEKQVVGYRRERTVAFCRHAAKQGQRYNDFEDGMAQNEQVSHQHPQQLEDVRI